jgi:hypothetical protein
LSQIVLPYFCLKLYTIRLPLISHFMC